MALGNTSLSGERKTTLKTALMGTAQRIQSLPWAGSEPRAPRQTEILMQKKDLQQSHGQAKR